MFGVAQQTSDVAGDGTPPPPVLAQAIYREGRKDGAPAAIPWHEARIEDKRLSRLRSSTKKTANGQSELDSSPSRLGNDRTTGTISANNERRLDIIAEAMKKWQDGVITDGGVARRWRRVEVSKGCSLTVVSVAYFVTDPERMEWLLKLLLRSTEKKISSMKDLSALLGRLPERQAL